MNFWLGDGGMVYWVGLHRQEGGGHCTVRKYKHYRNVFSTTCARLHQKTITKFSKSWFSFVFIIKFYLYFNFIQISFFSIQFYSSIVEPSTDCKCIPVLETNETNNNYFVKTKRLFGNTIGKERKKNGWKNFFNCNRLHMHSSINFFKDILLQ